MADKVNGKPDAKSTAKKASSDEKSPPTPQKRVSVTKETDSVFKPTEKDTDKKVKSSSAKESDTETDKFFAEDFTAQDRLKQYEEIEQDIYSRPLIGWKEVGFDSLYEELKSAPQFTRKLPFLATKYFALRRVRGDGNCFYRGFMFRLVETIVTQYLDNNNRHGALFQQIKSKVDTSLQYLLASHYDAHSVEFFVDIAKSFFSPPTNTTNSTTNSNVVANLDSDTDELTFPTSELELETLFGDPSKSMYLVWFSKLLAAAFIKQNWTDRFSFFVEGPYESADDFCRQEVEPTDCEASQIQITALCEYFEVKICVEYFDASAQKDETESYYFGPEVATEAEKRLVGICLLYRPGHYDIIYSNNELN